MYFRDFSTTLFPSIQDKSFDLAFATFDETSADAFNITDEEERRDDKVANFLKRQRDEKIEGLLQRKYEAILRDESRKAAIDSEMSFELTRRIDSKIEKQIRDMKTRDSK